MNNKREENPRVQLNILIVGVFLIAGVCYKYFVVPSEGYRYTVALIVRECSTPRRGEGYILRYTANGEQFETRCDPNELMLLQGRKYILQYAVENPIYYNVLNYELIDSVVAPLAGWTELPKGFIKNE